MPGCSILRPPRRAPVARWRSGGTVHRGDQYPLRHRMDGTSSDQPRLLRLHRQRYRPCHHHPRLPGSSPLSTRLIGNFKYFWLAFTLLNRMCDFRDDGSSASSGNRILWVDWLGGLPAFSSGWIRGTWGRQQSTRRVFRAGRRYVMVTAAIAAGRPRIGSPYRHS